MLHPIGYRQMIANVFTTSFCDPTSMNFIEWIHLSGVSIFLKIYKGHHFLILSFF